MTRTRKGKGRRRAEGSEARRSGRVPASTGDARTWSPALVATLGALVVALHLAVVAAAWMPAPHSGGDNAAYVALADALVEGEGYTEVWDPARPPHTKYPPVFPLLLAGAIALGARTWASLKLVSAASTTATVALTFLWARRRGHEPLFAAAAAGLLGISAALVGASHWILSDPPFVALTLLALWALTRVEAPGAPGRRIPDPGVPAEPAAGGSGRGGGAARGDAGWLALACAAAVLAYFTRSAGLPLLVALAGWLALRRRWGALGAFALAAGAPALLWWMRARSAAVAQGAYGEEFWLRDPYAPELGRVGAGEMVGRVVENALGYVGGHIPVGLVGPVGAAAWLLGVGVVGLAAVGWGRRLRSGPGVAELFTPLYLGLILLWPPVWSGDRFALPLFPLLLVYGGEALVWAAARAGKGAVVVAGVVAVAALGIPATGSWTASARQASACSGAVDRGGPWACWGARFGEIVEAARWSAASLPPGSAVLSRKPRIFYAVSGVPSRTYPFTDDPDALLAAADAAGARYVLLDFFGRQGPTYVGGAVSRRPGAFCALQAFDLGGGGVASQLLGILPPGARGEGVGATGSDVRVAGCPRDMVSASPGPLPPADARVPLLVP